MNQSTRTNTLRKRLWLGLTALGLVALGVVVGFALAEELTLPESMRHLGISPPQVVVSPQPDSSSPHVQRVSFPSGGVHNSTLTEVAKRARPAVVNILTRAKVQTPKQFQSPFFDDPFFRRFFGDEFERRFKQPETPQPQGTGSGVIVSRDGYIITNNHVVEHADDVQVTLSDKRTFDATVVGTDPKTDIALIKIDADDLPILPWADSRELEVGEVVMAIGNPFGLNQTVTMGIVSAVGRANVGIVDYEDFIQTDAAINPGNSGGALVNLQGELVGINTAIFSRSGGYMGIGFAIPSNMAKAIQSSLTEHGKVVRGWLGVSIQDLTADLQEQFDAPDQQGVLVSDVMEDSPAEEGGLQRGDIIRQYDSYDVNDSRHLRSLVAETPPKHSVALTILREGESQKRTITIAEMPEDVEFLASAGEAKGKHALAGLTVKPAASGKQGVEVTEVEPGSAANRAGIRKGDHIREINRQEINTMGDFEEATRKLGTKDRLLLLIQRGRGTLFLSITP